MTSANPQTPSPAKQTSRLPWRILIILVGGVALAWGLCSPLDIAADPSRNGGYGQGMIFILKTPIQVTHNGMAIKVGSTADPALSVIPVGTRLQILRVDLQRMLQADNQFRTRPIAKWLDGPQAGQTVNLVCVSLMDSHRRASLDPDILAPEASPSATTATNP